MLAIPVKFLDSNVYTYQQTCKRAANLLETLASKHYIISERKWFRTMRYEVNVFGEMLHKYGDLSEVLEKMLEEDYISTLDYQLLKFYDLSDMIDQVLDLLNNRRAANAETVDVDVNEMQLLYHIGTFIEDPTLSKEDLLSGE